MHPNQILSATNLLGFLSAINLLGFLSAATALPSPQSRSDGPNCGSGPRPRCPKGWLLNCEGALGAPRLVCSSPDYFFVWTIGSCDKLECVDTDSPPFFSSDSVCLRTADTYPAKPGARSGKRGVAGPEETGSEARKLEEDLNEVGKRAESCRLQIECACVTADKKMPFGYYSKTHCPVQRGAFEECDDVEGFQCVFPCVTGTAMRQAKEGFTDEKCAAEFPGTRALCSYI
ncbi:hypothetical protein OQA88_4865 [Cercophora sp. LCS_1]